MHDDVGFSVMSFEIPSTRIPYNTFTWIFFKTPVLFISFCVIVVAVVVVAIVFVVVFIVVVVVVIVVVVIVDVVFVLVVIVDVVFVLVVIVDVVFPSTLSHYLYLGPPFFTSPRAVTDPTLFIFYCKWIKLAQLHLVFIVYPRPLPCSQMIKLEWVLV